MRIFALTNLVISNAMHLNHMCSFNMQCMILMLISLIVQLCSAVKCNNLTSMKEYQCKYSWL